MAGLSAAGSIAVQLEQVQDTISLAVEKSGVLDAKIQDNGRAKKVSTKSYRIVVETALPGAVSKVNLDSGSVEFPAGGNSEWNQLTVTPIEIDVPIEWTKLAELAAQGEVAITNTVSIQMGRAADRLRQARDMFLQTDGTGKLATIATGGVAGNTLTLTTTPFGARLLVKNQVVQVFNGNTLRGSCTITKVLKSLGGTPTVVVDAAPGGTAQGDFLRVAGVEDGGPVFINGIPVFHSTSTVGTVLGRDRGNDDVVANGVDAGGGQITAPLLRVPFNQIMQAVGEEGMKDLVPHTHPAQVAAFEEMGWQLQTVPLEGGKAGDFDPLFRGKKMIDGHPILTNIHADTTRIDYLNLKAWGKVKYGNPPFWFTQEGRKVFEIYGSNGSITAGARSHMIDCIQYFVDNFKSISSITNLKVPANY